MHPLSNQTKVVVFFFQAAEKSTCITVMHNSVGKKQETVRTRQPNYVYSTMSHGEERSFSLEVMSSDHLLKLGKLLCKQGRSFLFYFIPMFIVLSHSYSLHAENTFSYLKPLCYIIYF